MQGQQRVASLEAQLAGVLDALQEETRQKLALQSKFKGVQDDQQRWTWVWFRARVRIKVRVGVIIKVRVRVRVRVTQHAGDDTADAGTTISPGQPGQVG